jgi:hypothetical protein
MEDWQNIEVDVRQLVTTWGVPGISTKSKIGFQIWTPQTDLSSHSPQII